MSDDVNQEPKSWRTTLQECVEDDNTKRGSGSRLALILPIGTFCLCLIVLIYAHAFWGKDTVTGIKVLVGALTLGGGGPYTLKQLFGKSFDAQPTTPQGAQDQSGGGPT